MEDVSLSPIGNIKEAEKIAFEAPGNSCDFKLIIMSSISSEVAFGNKIII